MNIYETAAREAVERARTALRGDDPDEIRAAATGLVASTGLLLSRLSSPRIPAPIVEEGPSESWWRRFAPPWSRPARTSYRGRHHLREPLAIAAGPAVINVGPVSDPLAITATPARETAVAELPTDDAPTVVINTNQIRDTVNAS